MIIILLYWSVKKCLRKKLKFIGNLLMKKLKMSFQMLGLLQFSIMLMNKITLKWRRVNKCLLKI